MDPTSSAPTPVESAQYPEVAEDSPCGSDRLSAQQQLAIDQGMSQKASAFAFYLRRALERRPSKVAQAMREGIAREVARAEQFVTRRGNQLSSLDRELLLHWLGEADEQMRALSGTTPVVARLLRDLAPVREPWSSDRGLAWLVDLQQAIVDTEDFLHSRRARALSAAERGGLEFAQQRAQALLSTVQG